jgi:isoprenylcysteine carboxyl methyltransferase (ICMT) family protein YpbQ
MTTVPHCENCGHATEWPVRVCWRCVGISRWQAMDTVAISLFALFMLFVIVTTLLDIWTW